MSTTWEHEYRLAWEYPDGITRRYSEWQPTQGTLLADAVNRERRGFPAWVEVRDISAPYRLPGSSALSSTGGNP